MASRSLARMPLPTCRHSIRRSAPVWATTRAQSTTTPPPSTTLATKSTPSNETPASTSSDGKPTSTSSDDMRAARISSQHRQHLFGAHVFSDGSRTRPVRRPGLQAGEMDMPSWITDPSRANKPSEAASLKQLQDDTFAQHPRLNPTYGRTVDLDVKKGRDIARGLGMLASLVARNRILADTKSQKFHERPGLRRKRLARERWRARFRKGFQQVTARVSELTRKGW